MEQKERELVISQINIVMGISSDNKTLEWSLLCQNTDFDSTATALYFGIGWESDMLEASIGHLKMALFNITNFPYGSRNKYNIERKKKKELRPKENR